MFFACVNQCWASTVSSFLGQVLTYGLGTAGVLFLLFKKIAETWIEKRFEHREKDFEHDRAVEMQRLRVSIDTAIQGAIRMQEREFKLLPEAWERVSEAFGLARWLCSPMQQMGSISPLSDSEIEEFLAKSDRHGRSMTALAPGPLTWRPPTTVRNRCKAVVLACR